MTNKTELLRLLRLAWITDHVSAEDCKKIDVLLAELAEDVRAVVDQPVEFKLKECADGYGHAGRWCGPTHNCWLDPRDRKERGEDFERRRSEARQRPMVLPERMTGGTASCMGWNACLDRIAELNK